MEEIIAVDSDEEKDEGSKSKEEKDEFSPTQPVFLSQKAELIEQSQRDKLDIDINYEDNSIDDILGDKILQQSPDRTSKSKVEKAKTKGKKANEISMSQADQYRITNNEEKISNSSSPIVNENLQKQAEL